MSMNAAALLPADRACRLADLMLPGDATRWPAASACISNEDLSRVLSGLSSCTAQNADELALWQAENPERFSGAFDGLCDLYYSTPQVTAVVTTLAEAGPGPEDTPFDPARLSRRA